jgi:hypothetical protein
MTQRFSFDPEQLHAYIDDELPTDERAAIDRAVESDAGLRQELLELQATASLLASLPEFTPRRSFQLGKEHARPTPISAGRVVRLLPIMRTLSVAAAIMFMVVGGALFLDLNGNSPTDPGKTFTQQNVIMGVTDPPSQASQDAEDETSADTGMVSRGDTASADEAPVESLPVEAPASAAEPAPVAANGDAESSDRDLWVLSVVALGAVVLVSGGVWYTLAHRDQHSSISQDHSISV